MFDFKGKIAVVTGGTRGIGRCICEQFKVAGATVCVIDLLDNDYFAGDLADKTTLDIYSHMTDTMQMQAAVRIDREIGGTNAEMPEPPPPKVSDEPLPENATEAVFEPYKPKIRKSGTVA